MNNSDTKNDDASDSNEPQIPENDDINFFAQGVKLAKVQSRENSFILEKFGDPKIKIVGGLGNCMHGGVRDTIKLRVWVCNNQVYSKEKWEVEMEKEFNKNNGKCFTKEMSIDACYCPYDYYGRRCEGFIGFACDNFSYTKEDAKCLADDPKIKPNRVYVPNCRLFENKKDYNFEVKFDCHTANGGAPKN